MIDWFPPTTSDSPARSLARWNSIVSLRRAARAIDAACIPQSILVTPGRLTPEEYEMVKTHAALGADVVEAVLAPRQVRWIRHHHERWDGRGYPDGLVAEEIPEGALILAIADAWDAMTHRSWAGAALTREAALDECRRERGGQFAPWVVDALLEVLDGPLPQARPRPRLRLVSAA